MLLAAIMYMLYTGVSYIEQGAALMIGIVMPAESASIRQLLRLSYISVLGHFVPFGDGRILLEE